MPHYIVVMKNTPNLFDIFKPSAHSIRNLTLTEVEMTSPDENTTPEREPWEKEIFVHHRWGRHGKDLAGEQHAQIKIPWEAAQPLDERSKEVVMRIIDLEVCNWDLESNILKLCQAIGKKDAAGLKVGHLASVTEDRWKQVWAYYLTLRNWLSCVGTSGYPAILTFCDPDGSIRKKILDMLGESTELKELYVARLCLCLESWLAGILPPKTARMKGHNAAVSVLEKEIKTHDPDSKILVALRLEGDGRLQPCHHKAFRRYDIIISSIGSGIWRSEMPRRGTDGFERAETLDEYLTPIEEWVNTRGNTSKSKGELTEKIQALLGEPDDTKIFLAAFLASILRAQQLTSKKWAEERTG